MRIVSVRTFFRSLHGPDEISLGPLGRRWQHQGGVADEETIAVFEAGFPILKKIIVTGSAAQLSKSAYLLGLEGDSPVFTAGRASASIDEL